MEVNLLKLLIIFSAINCFVVSDHITILAPPSFRSRMAYSAFLSTSHMTKPTYVAVKFKDATSVHKVKKMMADNSVNTRLTLGNRGKNNTLTVVARRTINNQDMCVSMTHKIRRNNKKFETFIQLDKPLYRPGESMSFRVVTIDSDVRPYQIANILIDIIDAEGNRVYQYKEIDDQPFLKLGIFQAVFPFSKYPNLGNWTMKVWIDNQVALSAEKIFSVEKTSLPFYSVTIDVFRKVLRNSNRLDILFYAKYAFGQYVKGTAKMTVTHVATGHVYKQETFNVDTLIQRKYSLDKDLGLNVVNADQDFVVKVEFEDSSSGTKMEKSETFTVTSKKEYEVRITPTSAYTPGLTYTVNVEIIDWMGNRVRNKSEPVEVNASFNNKKITIHEFLSNGLATISLKTDKDVEGFDLEATFFLKKFKSTLKVSRSVVSETRIGVVVPKIISINSNIEVNLESPTFLNKVNLVVVGKAGMSYGAHVNCKGKYECKINVQTTVDMMPRADLRVYAQSGDSKHFLKGEAILVFDQLGENYLNISTKDGKTNFKPKDDVTLQFKSQPKSTIAILGIDKRLTFLRDGHDIDEKSVINAVMDSPKHVIEKNNFDGVNFILEMILVNFHPCTPEEANIIDEAWSSTGDISQRANDKTYIVKTHAGEDEEPEDPANADPEIPYIRKHFPERWMFETIDDLDENGFKEINRKIPDSMTSWVISAFSMHKTHGLALAKPIELVVSSQFFVNLNLPYSMRFGEVLKLDIIVFNMMNTPQEINANVEIIKSVAGKDQFKVVEFKTAGSCGVSLNNQNTKNIQIPHRAGSRTFFHIDPSVIGKMKIRVKVTTTVDGVVHRDAVEREIIVENEGISYYVTDNHEISYKTRNSTTLPTRTFIPPSASDPETVLFTGTAIGHMLGNNIDANFNERDILNPRGCAEQTSSSFMRTLYVYRGLEVKGYFSRKAEAQRYLQVGVQRLMKWRKRDGSFSTLFYQPSSTWTTAYIARILGQALRLRAIYGCEGTISSALHYLSRTQNADGSFQEAGYAKTPNYPAESTRNVRFTSFVLLAFLENRNMGYDNVIRKAFDFIENRIASADNYAASVAAFALAMGGKNELATTVLDMLEKTAIVSGNSVYWNMRGNEYTSPETINLITSYTALAYLKLEDAGHASRAVNYLMRVKNPNGLYGRDGYHESHDTAIAMEAIAEMSKRKVADQHDLTISFTNQNYHKEEMRVTNTNWNKVQYIEMPKYSNGIVVKVDGLGYATMALIIEYFLTIDKISNSYTLALEYNRGDAQKAELRACATNIGPPKAEMTIMQFVLTGGYVYDNSLNPADGKIISQVDFAKAKTVINLYIPAMTRNQVICATIKAKKAFEISNFKRASVKVFLYSERNDFAARFFDVGKNSCM